MSSNTILLNEEIKGFPDCSGERHELRHMSRVDREFSFRFEEDIVVSSFFDY